MPWRWSLFFIAVATVNFNKYHHTIRGVMVSVLSPSVVYRGFEPRSRQTKNYDIGMRCFSANHAAWTRKSEDWMARNKNNVSG